MAKTEAQFRTEFFDQFRSVENKEAFCVLTLMAWMAACDGVVSAEEEDYLSAFADTNHDAEAAKHAVRRATEGNLVGVRLACEVARMFSDEHKALILDLAVGVALGDGYLRTPEALALFFLGDLLGFGPAGVDAAFRKATGQTCPRPGDVSSMYWWLERDRAASGASGDDSEGAESQGKTGKRTKSDLGRVRAYATLGVEEGASATEVRNAYRRLARVHHPDRFAPLGDEAVKQATETFQRIQRAYETLGAP